MQVEQQLVARAVSPTPGVTEMGFTAEWRDFSTVIKMAISAKKSKPTRGDGCTTYRCRYALLQRAALAFRTRVTVAIATSYPSQSGAKSVPCVLALHESLGRTKESPAYYAGSASMGLVASARHFSPFPARLALAKCTHRGIAQFMSTQTTLRFTASANEAIRMSLHSLHSLHSATPHFYFINLASPLDLTNFAKSQSAVG